MAIDLDKLKGELGKKFNELLAGIPGRRLGNHDWPRQHRWPEKLVIRRSTSSIPTERQYSLTCELIPDARRTVTVKLIFHPRKE